MRTLFTLMMSLLLTVGMGFAQQIKRHAVIIAIGDYPDDSGWKDISSANDVELLEPVFRKAGFDNIIKLVNAEATKKNIQNTLRDLANRVQPGDQVIVHISSHGQQIWDDGDDEVDGYDEAIVTYGAPAYFTNSYNGEEHLRDEELGALLDLLRARSGSAGDVVVFIDACHSGTGTRGDAIVRGGVPAMAPPGHLVKKGRDAEAGMFENRPNGINDGELAPMVVFSAARAEELNYEFKGFGSLSVAIERVFGQLIEGMTYRSFFAQMLKEMSVIAPKQNPAIEGEVDRELFGGKYVTQQKYYNLRSLDGNWAFIDGGTFTGVHKETEMAIYPAGTVSTEGQTPIASGKIISTEATRSTLQLNKNLAGKATDYWAFTTVQTFGDRRVSLRVQEVKDKNFRKAMETAFENHPLIVLTKEKELADFSLKQTGNEIRLFDAGSGEEFNVLNHPDPIAADPVQARKQLEEILTTYAQGKYLKDLDLNHPQIQVNFELIPVRVVDGVVVDTLNRSALTQNGTLMIQEGQEVLVRIHNRSKIPVYFNLVDVQPDGVINLLIPDPEKNENASEYKIPAESVYMAPKYISIYPPYGTEVFKVFASSEPIDFRPMHTNKGKPDGARGVEKDIETLFGGTYQIATRGGGSKDLRGGTKVSTVSTTFKIVQPK